MLFFIFAFSIFALTTAINTNFSYPYPRCHPGNVPYEPIAIGDTTYLCLNINGQVVSLYNVLVDKFSAINVKGSNLGFPPNSGYIHEGSGWVPEITFGNTTNLTETFYQVIDIASGDVFSDYPKIYKKVSYTLQTDGNYTAEISTIPVMTVMIQLDQGNIVSIGWDDGCFFCAENTDSCTHNSLNASSGIPLKSDLFRSCSSTVDNCVDIYGETNSTFDEDTNTSIPVNTTITGNTCDLKVFLTWSGTDKNGQFLTSVNKRFSRFRQYAVATMYQSALNLVEKGKQIAEDSIGYLERLPGRIEPRELSSFEEVMDLPEYANIKYY